MRSLANVMMVALRVLVVVSVAALASTSDYDHERADAAANEAQFVQEMVKESKHSNEACDIEPVCAGSLKLNT